jgi:hypothetical protein
MSKARFALILTALSMLALAGACDKEKGLRITGFEPKTGPYTGGDAVVFSGGGFTADGVRGVEIWFGDKKGKNVRFRGDDQMIVDTPGGAVGEVVDIAIRFDGARGKTFAKAYTYIDPAAGFGVGELTDKDKAEQE